MSNFDWDGLVAHAAMEAAGVIDPDQVNEVAPITYGEVRGASQYLTVYFVSEKSLLRVVLDVTGGVVQSSFADTFRLKNITDVRIDALGCVIQLNTGKKIELVNHSIEGPESFMDSVRGLHTRWDDVV